MQSNLAVALAALVVCGGAAAFLGPWLFRRIPEPELDEGDTKLTYRSLATRRAAIWCGIGGAIAGVVLGLKLDWSAPLAAWLALAISGAVLCYVDLRTRYLPSAIIWPTYAVVALLLLGASAATGDWGAFGRAAAAGAVGFAVFYLLWFVYPAGIGFGDVRLSGLLSGALGWLGWSEMVIGVYGGFVLGAVLGVLLTALKVFDRKAFAFGPFMLVGALAGVVLGEPVARAYLG
ncbi:prepilin peptidase [Kribbella deserti]|uniref:Prepilin peptidase n=1 Tax=Kribbella deserti TaxID=1926257 RepID=A0ABV6QH27_9ACTN